MTLVTSPARCAHADITLQIVTQSTYSRNNVSQVVLTLFKAIVWNIENNVRK